MDNNFGQPPHDDNDELVGGKHDAIIRKEHASHDAQHVALIRSAENAPASVPANNCGTLW
jgi:hypothetical protein